jgi:pyruvate,water dikinase
MKIVDWLENFGIGDIGEVGGKNGSLGEMIRNISKLGIKVPNGYVITTGGFQKYLEHNNISTQINEILKDIDYGDHVDLKRSGLKIRNLIQNGIFPEDIEKEILLFYSKLSSNYKDSEGISQDFTDVAIRSSSTAEDLPEASFAGQQETYLNIRGSQQVIDSIKNCFASLFTDRAISYRNKIKFPQSNVSISVCVQKMVRSDLGSAGVAFTIDPDSGFKDAVIINGSWGLGEMVVGGSVTPDEFVLYKPNLKKGIDSIIDKKLGNKSRKMIYDSNPKQPVIIVKVSEEKKKEYCISEEDIIKLGHWCTKIEDYYCDFYGKWCPVDIEWAVDGITNQLFILQARPETVYSNKNKNILTSYNISKEEERKILVEGIAVGEKIKSGKVKIMYSLDERDGSIGEDSFNEGDILVTDITTPDWENIMQKAGGIITNKGGRVCHAAIIAREFGIPTIVGTKNCTDILKNFQEVTVSCCEGEKGFVYDGNVRFDKKETEIDSIEETKTKMMINIANPHHAFKNSMLPHQGVGLLRLEFIINNFIKVHPNALIHYDLYKDTKIKDEELWDNVRELIGSYKNGEEYYIKKLSYGVGRIAAAFHPHPVVVRFSDFKSNEYKSLLGGKYFEPDEENPMIGWRGCSRYYDPKFIKAFGYECKAIKYLREEMGFKNIVVMLPFCRTIGEVERVQEVMSSFGLIRGEEGLEVYLMCEIPANVMMGLEFSKYVDGFSIGSNDLTQLTLGLDRDSELVSHLFDEQNESVKRLIRIIINTCKMTGKKIGICGQAPSDYPEFAEFLVKNKIDSLSLIPDSLIDTKIRIGKFERGE